MNLKQIKESQIYQKYQFLIVPVIAAIVCILLLVFILLPQISNSFTTSKNLEAAQNKYNELNKKIKTLEEVDITSYKEGITTALTAVPSDKDIPGSINQLLFMINNSELKMINIVISTTGTPIKALNSFNVKLDVEGDLAQIKDFITQIKKAPRIIELNGVELSTGKDNKAQASLSLLVFYQEISNNLEDVEKEVTPLNNNDKQTLSTISENSKNISSDLTPILNGPRGKDDPFN